MLKLQNGRIEIDKHVILDNINLEINPSLLTIIIGPNGAGKTSLLKVLANSRKLSSGTMVTNYKKSILIPQGAFYPEGISLYEYVSSVFYQKGWKWFITKEEQILLDQVLEKLNLCDKKDLHLYKLSSGEIQLANIALCLASGADFILLDEPSANLDLLNQIMILDILKKLTNKGITIVTIMHDINLASKFGDWFVTISKDGQLFYGEKHNIITQENLSRVYNVDFNITEIDDNIFVQPNL